MTPRCGLERRQTGKLRALLYSWVLFSPLRCLHQARCCPSLSVCPPLAPFSPSFMKKFVSLCQTCYSAGFIDLGFLNPWLLDYYYGGWGKENPDDIPQVFSSLEPLEHNRADGSYFHSLVTLVQCSFNMLYCLDCIVCSKPSSCLNVYWSQESPTRNRSTRSLETRRKQKADSVCVFLFFLHRAQLV